MTATGTPIKYGKCVAAHLEDLLSPEEVHGVKIETRMGKKTPKQRGNLLKLAPHKHADPATHKSVPIPQQSDRILNLLCLPSGPQIEEMKSSQFKAPKMERSIGNKLDVFCIQINFGDTQMAVWALLNPSAEMESVTFTKWDRETRSTIPLVFVGKFFSSPGTMGILLPQLLKT